VDRDAFWIAAYSVGAAQGAFLAVSLLLKRSANRRAAQALAALVGVMTVSLLFEMAERLGAPFGRMLGVLNVNTELAFGPLLVLFFGALVGPERAWRRVDALHFAPLALGTSGWIAYWTASRAGAVELSGEHFRIVLGAFMAFKVAYFFVYWGLTWRTLDRGLRELRGFADGRRVVELDWLRRWLLALAGLVVLIYLSAFTSLTGHRLLLPSDQLASLIVTVAIYALGLLVFQRPWILSVRPRPQAVERHAADVARLRAYLDSEAPYLDSALTLAGLATALDMTENRLSATINEGLGTGFQPLVNGYRLRRFEELAEDPALRHLAVLDLAFEAGFNSKATFYRVFREAHGTTPSAFLKRLRSARENS